jgi:hypothetical protein
MLGTLNDFPWRMRERPLMKALRRITAALMVTAWLSPLASAQAPAPAPAPTQAQTQKPTRPATKTQKRTSPAPVASQPKPAQAASAATVRPQIAAPRSQATMVRPPATAPRPQVTAAQPQATAPRPAATVARPQPTAPRTQAMAPRTQATTTARPPAANAPQRSAFRPTQLQPYSDYYLPEESRNHPGAQSILRHRTPSYPSQMAFGFRNPGGVGRYEEFYPPGNVFQNGGHDPTPLARFDSGGPGYNIQEQAMATQVGTNRYHALQQHLDNFGRPIRFWGFGWGFGAGMPF